MSNIIMSENELIIIDSQVKTMLDWVKTHRAEAEQLALDAAHLMSCTEDSVDKFSQQSFFQRCQKQFIGETGEVERAKTNNLIQMQKIALRYLNMLQEQQLLMAHSMLSLKNNLLSLNIAEEETKNIVVELAQKFLEQFNQLENRVDHLEISTNLQGWLFGLEEREYEAKIPTENMRLLCIINNFFGLKNDNWHYNDLIFIRKVMHIVGLNPKTQISIKYFISSLVDEIQNEQVCFTKYQSVLTQYAPQAIDDYSDYVLQTITSPVFVTMHLLQKHFVERKEIIEQLSSEMHISQLDALKLLLYRSLSDMNVNMDYEFTFIEIAIEILGCMRLSLLLAEHNTTATTNIIENEIEVNIQSKPIHDSSENVMKITIAEHSLGCWHNVKLPVNATILDIIYYNGQFFLALSLQNYISFYVSNNLEHWSQFYSSESEGHGKFLYVNNHCMFLSGKNLFVYHQDTFDHIVLAKACDQIYYLNHNWYAIGRNEESIFFSVFLPPISPLYILSGNHLNTLRQCYSTDQDFADYKYHRNIISNGHLLIGLITDHVKQDALLITSNNGYTWTTLNLALQERLQYLTYFNNTIYFEATTGLYSYDPETKSCKKYGKPNNDSQRYYENLQKIKFFDHYGICLFAGYRQNEYPAYYHTVYISNNMLSWIQIYNSEKDINHCDIKENFGFANKYFFIWSGNELFYREVKNIL